MKNGVVKSGEKCGFDENMVKEGGRFWETLGKKSLESGVQRK